MKLAPDALITRAKVVGYLLEWRPESDKAQFLRSAGYTIARVNRLADDIRALSDEESFKWHLNCSARWH